MIIGYLQLCRYLRDAAPLLARDAIHMFVDIGKNVNQLFHIYRESSNTFGEIQDE